MANLIDHTYFTDGLLSIPQVANTEGRADVTGFITRYENAFLISVLGYPMWKAFLAGIAGVPYLALLNGAEFTYNGKLRKWNGFVTTEKVSPIANFVYCKYLEDTATVNSLNGQVTQVTDNNSRTSPVKKITDAWNDMVTMLDELKLFLEVNATDYPLYDSEIEGYSIKNHFGL